MAHTSEFSLPEFLRSAEVYTDDVDADLSDDFQNAALPIYEEMENVMLQHGKESVENLLPLIVQVFENLDSTQRDNRRYLDTINAVSADNENLNSQFEEERLKRRERDSELIKIEETYDLEIRKLKRELDLSIQQCRQYTAKIQSVTENLQRAEERYDVLISRQSSLQTQNLHFRQLFMSDNTMKKDPSFIVPCFADSTEVDDISRNALPATYKDFSPNLHRNLKKRPQRVKLREKDLDVDKVTFNHGFDSSLSSSSEPNPVGHDLTSSFLPNKFNFKRESNESRSSRSNLFIFAGLGSDSHDDTRVITGKKRRTELQGSYSSYDSIISENIDLLPHASSNIPVSIVKQEQLHKIREQHFQTDDYSGISGYQTLQSTAFNPIIQENNKLQDEKNKLLTTRNTLESKLNTLQADVVVFQQRIEYLQVEEQSVNERNISLEAEIKRLKNTLADGQQIHNAGPEVFFGFTRTEMAQVLRERDQFKEKYWALKREYGALEAKRNQKSKILKFFLSIFKRSPQDEMVRPVSIILPQISHQTIEDQLNEISRNSTRNLFEEDSGPYDCAVSSEKATFVPFLRKIIPNEEKRVDAYGWTIPISNLGESFEDSIPSLTSENSIPSHIAALSCCRPVNPQEEGAKLWCATPVGEVMGNISHYNSSTTAALFWVCWGVPNLTKVSVVDSASTEILETFPVCASPLLAISFVPGLPGPSSPLNIERPTSKLATMWMGGDSGCLYIHSALMAWDKCLYALRLQSSVTDIKYSGGHVFAALTNGTLEIFSRNTVGEWDWDNHTSVLLGQRRDFPVLCLLPVNNKIWAGISHTVKILSDITHKEEYSIQVHYKVTSQVTNIVSYGYGVWLTIRQDSTLRLYNATTYDHLQDLDLAPKLHTLLQLPDNNSHIRITALLIANDSLWIGCDHGAILSIPFCDTFSAKFPLDQALNEEITSVYPLRSLSLNSDEEDTTNLSKQPTFKSSPFCSVDKFQLSFHGHTGPVRFILSASKSIVRSEFFEGLENQLETLYTATSLIVSGGEGHVDYRTSEGAIVGGPDMPMRIKNDSDPTVVVTDRNYFIVWQANIRNST